LNRDGTGTAGGSKTLERVFLPADIQSRSLLHLGYSEANRREERRLSCDPGNVRLEFRGRPEFVEGRIIEVSRSGLQLRLNASVQAGEPVSIIHSGTVISGEIRYCRPNDAGSFDAGVAILDFRQLQ
jgi:hypothetical protein